MALKSEVTWIYRQTHYSVDMSVPHEHESHEATSRYVESYHDSRHNPNANPKNGM